MSDQIAMIYIVTIATACATAAAIFLVLVISGRVLVHYLSEDCLRPKGVAEVYDSTTERWKEIGGRDD